MHDPALLGIVDGWVSGIGEETFDDLLPLLRRTFSRFTSPERRTIGEQVSQLGSHSPVHVGEALTLDLERARPAILRVANLLGLEVQQ